ncbi:hypothetical protein VP01_4066g1 [Puccinia sorghi]|uniref:Uncharacterized protein n=1 Tax=Puccinia sorghi TaxID=27349 RepID=A0A0L6URI5_9BASI|nr:hypothetical protein VP01_4066g1 [Puccinia sorghi]
MKRKILLLNPHHYKRKLRPSLSESFEIYGIEIINHLDNELFLRVFGWNTHGYENNLHKMEVILKTKKDVFTGKFKIRSRQETQKLWGRKRILSWNKQNLDLDFMNYLSSYLRINEKDNNLGLESLNIGLFKMIIFFRRDDQFLIQKIYKFLGTEINEVEAFRRILIISKQFYQVFIEKIKERLRDSPSTPPGLFENSKSAFQIPITPNTIFIPRLLGPTKQKIDAHQGYIFPLKDSLILLKKVTT